MDDLMLMQLTRLACQLRRFHADVVNPFTHLNTRTYDHGTRVRTGHYSTSSRLEDG
jgi:hypothetical protein